jgi:hypothetical protein
MAAKFFGQFLLEKGVLDKDQLLRALEIQRTSNPMLGEIAEQLGLLGAADARRINEKQKREDKRFGDIATELGLLTTSQVDALLAEQKNRRKLFGEILVEEGMLTREALAAELALHAADRDEAVLALELGLTGHALADVAGSAIATVSRIFQRVLKVQCQFSALAGSASDLAGFDRAGRIAISGDRPFVLAIACSDEVMNSVAIRFLNLPEHRCDSELAHDALGEVLNIVMGYVVKAALPEGGRYRASPPDFGVGATELMQDGTRSVGLLMTSQLGTFALILGE